MTRCLMTKYLTIRALAGLVVFSGLVGLSGCVAFPPGPEARVAPQFVSAAQGLDGAATSDVLALRTYDGAALPLRAWQPPADQAPRAIIIALHGMNDHAGMFDEVARSWADERAIATYAYDQRGFGRAPDRGLWPGTARLTADLSAAVLAARADHPDQPIFVLGHSMGAAVILAALGDGAPTAGDQARAPRDADAARAGDYARAMLSEIDGVILAAPAVWGGGELPFFYRAVLNVAARVAPGKSLTGERAARQASDNIEVLRAMARDPLMIRETRLDAVLGIVRLMDAAWRGADALAARTTDADLPILLMIGEKDEIIPVDAQEKLRSVLMADGSDRGNDDGQTIKNGESRTALSFPEGWHLLFRDLQRRAVWDETSAWIARMSDPMEHRSGAIGAAHPARDSGGDK